MLSLFSGSSALFLCFTHAEDLPARIMNPDGSENPPTRPQIDPDTTQISYDNSGRQCIRGLTNQTGYIKGTGNGNINFGTSSFTQSQSAVDNIAPRSDETRFLSSQNSGNQYNGNGIFNGGYLGPSSNTQSGRTARVDALRNLIAPESRMSDGTRPRPNSSSPSTLRGENRQPHNLSNIDHRRSD
ncbi:hypothetical protein L6164_026270 [Bauhinia variegata]|uniref:Uncharacterized protein n=2 Tax=Bauhinia variegata TaxID=167791 RepID=A0ACB9LR74_BAUVA|nr:hypothetical protein L6164_026268 [Bauhinia variegata]KAI4313279.1 hypothetical protein L6164_026270 [Bauhinia variegata]